MGREEGSGWGTHVYLWRIHFDIWQNQYNIVKFKNKIKLKKSRHGFYTHKHTHTNTHYIVIICIKYASGLKMIKS